MTRIATYLLLIGVLTGCTTTYEIKTKPEGGKIYVGDKLLGTTPMTFTTNDAPALQAGGVLARIEIEGYQRIFVWLPDDARQHSLTFNLTPFFRRALSETVVGELETERIDLYRLSERLLNLQVDLMTGSKKSATPVSDDLKRLTEANPTLGSMYFLEALQFLRNGRKEEGRKSLKTALRFSPNEFDFLALMNEIEGGEKTTNASKQ